MTRKKSRIGRKYKGQSDNPMFRANKAASELGGKLIPEAAAALDEQLKTFEGLSGGEF